MVEDESTDLSEAWIEEVESLSTKERVYEIVTELTAPTTVAEIAERADCSKEGARSNLEWFVEIGIVSKVAENPALYERNDDYFEFLRVHRLTREYTLEEIDTEIRTYEAKDEEFRDAFEVANPDDIDLYASRESFDETYDQLSEWRAVRRRLADLRRAKQRLEQSGEPGVVA